MAPADKALMNSLRRLWEFLHFVGRQNLAGARISVRTAWELATIWTTDKAGGGR